MGELSEPLELALLEFSLSADQLKAVIVEILSESVGCATDDWRTSLVSHDSSFVASFLHETGCCLTLRGYHNSKLLTIDVQEVVGSSSRLFPAAVVEKFCKLITTRLNWKISRPVVFVPRGGPINNLLFSSDNRLLVYDFDRVLVDVQSPFQHVQILHSTQFGNTLVLDDFVNLAESDLIYTHTFMRKGIEAYEGKNVLILGGGDGALLNEVLKEKPNFVTMIDIDQAVMDACRIHMRKACGSVLDTYTAANYKIIVSDCFPYLDEYESSGRKFQFVFSDLTDVPVAVDAAEKHDEFWDLMIRILDQSLNLLTPDGQLLNHLCGICSTDVIERYEKMLKDRGLNFVKTVAMVPSFLEPWVFYAIQQKKSS